MKQEILGCLKKIIPEDAEISVTVPEQISFGHYATNAAFAVARKKKQKPLEAAEDIADNLRRVAPKNLFERITVAPPGFVNFFLHPIAVRERLAKFLAKPELCGKNKLFSEKKVMIEYTDPNPFKEFHIGHLVTNAIGESLARLYEWSGAEVKRANYFGDVGIHVAKAVWGILKRGGIPAGTERERVRFLGAAYTEGNAAYEKNEEAKREIRELNKKIFARSDSRINAIYDEGRRISLDYFETLYRRLGTKFDYYFAESEVSARGMEIVEQGLKKNIFERSEGAVIFPGERSGLHTRVFVNREGLPTYEAKELGLAVLKYEVYSYDLSLVVTANEIVEYFKVLLAAMRELYPELAKKTKHIPHGFLRLAHGKMSSRTGTVIAADSLLRDVEEILKEKMTGNKVFTPEERKAVADAAAVGAVKYSILKQSIGKDIVFDFKASLSFEGDSGPYLQYTHARARSVLAKAKREGIAPSFASAPKYLHKLETFLLQFPDIVEDAVREHAPHRIASYLIAVSRLFNAYYAHERIADAGEEAPFRLALSAVFAAVLKNGLSLLGIPAPPRM